MTPIHKSPGLLFVLTMIITCSFNSTMSGSRKYLQHGDTLSVEDASDSMTSPDNSYTCGFYRVGINAYIFAIWFTDSRDRTVVWTANRDRPVNGRGAKASLLGNGALVLTDGDGTTTWQTYATSDDAAAELLDSGNLVLKNPRGEFLWQSFDYPTDTLLPSQLFTKQKRLVSSLTSGTYQSGYFSLYFDSDNVLRMIYDGPEVSGIYWPNPGLTVYENLRTIYNNTRVASFDEKGRFESSDLLKFSADNVGSVTRRRLTMDHDGNLRMYSLINSTWKVSWQAMAQTCYVKGVCGENAICVFSPGPKCSCPPGYRVRDLSDWSKGCEAKFDLRSSKEMKFVEVPRAAYYGFDLDYKQSISLEECEKLCLDNVLCVAFNYELTGLGVCFVKGRLYNGISTSALTGSMYLKMPTSVQISEPMILEGAGAVCEASKLDVPAGLPTLYVSTHKGKRWSSLYSFVSAFGAIEVMLVVLGWWFLCRRNHIPASVEDGYRMMWSQFKRFSYAELRKVTNNFAVELGRGASGSVYKGVLEDERVVAVKRLGDVSQAEGEFWAEMSTIGRINHMNVVRMWGFCSEKKHRLLVYEYVENSSLDKHLFTSNFLPWKQRFEVALGTAKGLAYLHHECLEWVIHCDVKPENILLDSEFQPKIADFGVAKLSQRGGSGSGVSEVRGTIGYMAPEWILNHPITAKVDVYGYGIVILEIVKGMRLSNWMLDDNDEHEAGQLKKFVRTVKRELDFAEDSWVESLVDPRLRGNYSRIQAMRLVEIGLACVEEDRNKRPTMSSVVQTLLEYQDQ